MSIQFDFQAPWDKEEELEGVWNTCGFENTGIQYVGIG